MSAAPGPHNEYSRGNSPSRGGLEGGTAPAWRATRRRSPPARRASAAFVFALAAVAAALLVAAEFVTLYQAHLATRAAPIQTVTAGSHNTYAMLPIALLAAALAALVWRSGSRLALVAIGLLGAVGLLIALLHDLPDAQAVGLADHNSVSATTTPGAGLYLETLGAVLLLAVSSLGLAFLGLPRRTRERPRRGAAPAPPRLRHMD
jgi:hypothetical protein